MIKFKTSDKAVFDDGRGRCSFLGRGQLVYNIVNRFIKETGVHYGFSGLFRNGKSSLFEEVARVINLTPASEYNGKMIALRQTLDKWSSADYSFFEYMMEGIHETVKPFLPHDVDVDPYYREFCACSRVVDRAKKAAKYLEYLHDHHFYVTLFIDEFQVLPNYESCTYQELSSLHQLPYINIGYVGRLPFNVTVQEMTTFPAMGAFLPCKQDTVRGFTDDDIALFSQEFLTQYNFDLSRFMDLIRYHCGRSPFLFSMIGEAIQTELDEHRSGVITSEWFATKFALRDFEDYKTYNINCVFKKDLMNGMDNLTRLQRIMIGPRIGIRKNDIDIMQEMGYIDRFGEQYYALTPSFVEWLRTQEITGELPVKMVKAERLLKHLIRSKASEIEALSEAPDMVPDVTRGYRWTSFDRAILGMRLLTVPESVSNVERYGKPYSFNMSTMEKYAGWLLEEHDQNRPADLLEVLLLRDRLGILIARWDLFSSHLGGTASEWRKKLTSWCTARNPALHANDYLTEQAEAECEQCCDEFLRRIGPMFPTID